MTFQKGHKLATGRPPGTPNKATTQARDAIAAFVDGNVDRLNGWLDKIAEKDPKDAFNAFMSVVEYNIPKLARHTLEGDKEKPIYITNETDDAVIARFLAKHSKDKQ